MVFQFNQFTLDTNQYRLSLSDNAVSIEPLVFNLLVYLIENRSRVVSREELLDNLWKGKVVTDAALGARLKDARRAIGDNGSRQQVIKTLHGRGYQFIAEVHEEPELAAVDQDDQLARDTDRKTEAETCSLAVLTLDNLSDDLEQQYFSDGVTQDIVTSLASIPGLHVVTFAPERNGRKASLEIVNIGKTLGVDYILDGSVRRDASRVRVSANLIDVGSGQYLWNQRYDRVLDDIFAVQDEITHQISLELRVRLSEGHKVRVLGRTRSFEAWERLLRADYLTNTLVLEDNLEARQLLEEAVAIDSGYAAAWTQLANTYIGDVFMGRANPKDSSLDAALEAAQKALDVEPGYPTALTVQGYAHLFRGDYDAALEAMRNAVGMEPRNAELLATCAYAMVFAGEIDEALVFIEEAMHQSPISPMWYFACLGMCRLARGEIDSAIETLTKAVEMEPASALARPYLSSALIEKQMITEAEQIAREVLRVEPGFRLSLWPGADFRDDKLRTKILANLSTAGIPD